MECNDRERLWEEYNLALKAFTDRVDELGVTSSAPAFGDKLLAVQAAKDGCKSASEAWEAHLRIHGCDMRYVQATSA